MLRRMHQFSVDAAAQRLLLANNGSARVADLYAIGMSKDQVARRVRNGVFFRVGYGVIGLCGMEDSSVVRASRAVLLAGRGAAACLWTAAELHRLDAPRSDQIHVVVEGPRKRSTRPDVRLHRTRSLSTGHVIAVDAVPTTSVDRTLVDCSSLLDSWQSLRLLDSVSPGRKMWERIHHTASALANGRAGVGAIADATAPDGADRFRSTLERRAADTLRAHGITDGEWNVAVHDARGRVREVDLCFRPARLIVEIDGLRYHERAGTRKRDRAEDRRLLLAGWRILRFTWRDVVHHPAAMIAEITQALAGF